VCIPLPLSANSGLGMKVTVLPNFLATFLQMYLYHCSASAHFTSVSNLRSISACPAVATSWCWASTFSPIDSMIRTISSRMSWRESVGGTGKYPSLWRGL